MKSFCRVPAVLSGSTTDTAQGRRQLFQVGAAPQSAGYCLGLKVLGGCPPPEFFSNLHALRLNLEPSEPK